MWLQLIDLAGRPSWWLAHLFLQDGANGGEDLDDGELNLEFPLPGDARLLLTVTSFSSELAFAGADGDPVSIAWDDEAHWHPALLRWVEFEALIAHGTAGVPWVARPDLAIALLHRFATVFTDDELRRASEMIGPPLRGLGLTRQQAADALERIDWRASSGPGWVRDDSVGWRMEPHRHDELPEPYSLRHPANEEFPPEFVTLLDRLVSAP